MTLSMHVSFVALVVALVSAGCSTAGPRCTAGASAACTCSSGAIGAQVCQADGTFGACMCSSAGLDAATPDAPVAPTDVGTDAPTTETPAPGCAPGMSVACACTDGRMGSQTCQPDRTYAACVCTGGDAGPADTGGCATSCDDRNDCTDDACVGGMCTHTNRPIRSLCAGGTCFEGMCFTCGAGMQACCQPGGFGCGTSGCVQCSEGYTCASMGVQICTPCGAFGQRCCPGLRCNTPDLVCDPMSGSGFAECQSCGAAGQRCCAGSTCTAPLVCNSGSCR